MSLDNEIALRMLRIESRRLPPTMLLALYGTTQRDEIEWDRVAITEDRKILAREVIRLMEWARRSCACDRGDYVGSPDMPLTLPPPDWKP